MIGTAGTLHFYLEKNVPVYRRAVSSVTRRSNAGAAHSPSIRKSVQDPLTDYPICAAWRAPDCATGSAGAGTQLPDLPADS